MTQCFLSPCPASVAHARALLPPATPALVPQVPRELHYTCACAPVVAGQLGVYGIKPTVLNDFLAGAGSLVHRQGGAGLETVPISLSPVSPVCAMCAGTRVDASTSEGAFSRTFSSSQSPEDLDVALQLVHALFTTK